MEKQAAKRKQREIDELTRDREITDRLSKLYPDKPEAIAAFEKLKAEMQAKKNNGGRNA